MNPGADESFDVAVIGSGIGGLAAALASAIRGKRVVVIEGAKELGGYLAPFRRSRFHFDPGLHYVGACRSGEAFARVLERLGLSREVLFRELDRDGFDRLNFPGYSVAMPAGPGRYRDRLALDFPHERPGLDAFFSMLSEFRVASRIWDEAEPHAPFPRFFVDHGRATFGEVLHARFRDPLLRAVLAAQSGNYAMPPGRASLLVGLGVLDHYLGGAHFPIGGSAAIRDAFVAAIRRHGGVLHKGCAVSKIVVRRGRVAAVACADGRAFTVPTVISNADPAVTCLELVGAEHLPLRMKRRAERARPSLGSFNLFIGTRADPRLSGLTEANVWHSATLDLDEAYAPLFRGELPRDDWFFLSAPSLKDPKEGAPHTLFLSAVMPFEPFARWADTDVRRRGGEYDDLKRRLTDRYLACVERYVPGVRIESELVEASTPLTNVAFAGAPRGGAYGPEHSPDQLGPLRCGFEGAVRGLFFCGSGARHAGIVACAMSGFAASASAIASDAGTKLT